MKDWTTLASQELIDTTVKNLEQNGMHTVVVENGAEAKAKVFELLPEGAEVMNMTSVTLDAIGVAQEIVESGRYNSVRKTLNTMDRATQSLAMQKLGAAPEWTVGSVHAITEKGQVVTVSNTGSQLPAYASASPHVIWVVGTHKIVKDLDQAMERIEKHTLVLESARIHKLYGIGSNISKILIVQKELSPSRITIILVKEALGF